MIYKFIQINSELFLEGLYPVWLCFSSKEQNNWG